MKQSMRDILVGLTVILGLVGVASLLILFGELSIGAQPQYRIYLQLDRVSGLEVAARVTLNGVVIGAVENLEVARDPREGTIATLSIRDGVQIPRNVEVLIERGLVGAASLLLRTPQDPVPDSGFIQPGETLNTKALTVLDDIAQAIDSRLASLKEAGDSFTRLSDTYIEVGERAKAMLAPLTLEEVEAGAPANIPSTLARIDAAVGNAQLWLGDAKLREGAHSAVASLNEALQSGASAVEQWTAAAKVVSSRVDQVSSSATEALEAFTTAARGLDESLADLRSITAKINRGEGTAGMLVNNPDLYRSLNDAATRLERALTEAQLLIEKYRKEGVPIQF